MFILIPFTASAAGTAADAICVASNCSLTPQEQKQTGKPLCTVTPCQDAEPGGITKGMCANKTTCKAVSSTGLNGQSSAVDTGMKLLGQVLGPLLSKLLAPSPAAPAAAPAATTATSPTGTSGCTSYYPTSAPSSDPCAYYVPPTSSSLTTGTASTLTTSDQLLNALGGSTGSTDTSNTNTNTNTNLVTPLLGQLQTAAGTVAASTTSTTTIPTFLGLSGASGDIQLLPNGATIIGSEVDTSGNSAVAGFYGGDTFGTGQPQGLAAQLCESRPWASSVVSYVIPASFFDGLCQWQGYQVGTPPAAAQVQQTVTLTQQTPAPVAATTTPVTTTSVIAPQVQIWAVPASVALDTRASIFWNTQGVTNCTETSPDGSFTENTLSGGAATVPLTGATTYTISCLDSNNNPVTGYVTVNLSI